MLQSKAGYIDARPHIRPLDEVLLQRTAGPYIWVNHDRGGQRHTSTHVRFAPKADELRAVTPGPPCANRVLTRRSKKPPLTRSPPSNRKASGYGRSAVKATGFDNRISPSGLSLMGPNSCRSIVGHSSA